MNRYLLILIFSSFLFSCKKEKEPPPVPNPTIINFNPDTGYDGTQVIIYGTNFSAIYNDNEVKFNGITGKILVLYKDSMIAEVPYGATTGKISVKVNGKSVSSSKDFKVKELTGSWVEKAPFGGSARGWANVFTIGGKAYLTGGYSASGYESDLWEYDTSANHWTRKADLPAKGRYNGVAFTIDNKGYFGLGFVADIAGNYSGFKDFWEYDPAIDKWTKKADFPGTGYMRPAAFAFANTGFVGLGGYDAGGFGETAYSKEFWQYDAVTDKWTKQNDFPGYNLGGVGSVCSTSTMGFVFCWGDFSDAEFWQFNPVTNTWASLPFSNFYSFAINNKLYSFPHSTFWEFDLITNTLDRKANFNRFHDVGSVAFSIGNRGFVATGATRVSADKINFFNDFWQFTP